MARVIPIHTARPGDWQGDLLHFLVSNPKHLAWLLERPFIQHFIDDVLFAEVVHVRADELALYHSAFRFEVDFQIQGRRHRVQVPHDRWALPILMRLKQMAGLDPTNAVAWQIGEMIVGGGLHIAAFSYPGLRSERLVLRPRWVVRNRPFELQVLPDDEPAEAVSHA